MLVADECWVGLANLHREHPERAGFSAREIMNRIAVDSAGPVRAGVQPHLYHHNVANLKPSSAKYRMFFRLDSGELRLFRPVDEAHPERRGKIRPVQQNLPPELQHLVRWYEDEYCGQITRPEVDPVLAMIGVGKGLWANEDGDTYIRREREASDWVRPEVSERPGNSADVAA